LDNYRYGLDLHDYSAATATTPIVNPGQERKDGVINVDTCGGTAEATNHTLVSRFAKQSLQAA